MPTVSDPVVACVEVFDEALRNPALQRAMGLTTNGKIEVPLKHFLAAAWVTAGGADRRHCVMDKKMNGQQVDLLGLQGPPNGPAKPQFWVELKCNAAAKPFETRTTAAKAVVQFLRVAKAVESPNWGCPARTKRNEVEAFRSSWGPEVGGYIIHFLNPLPDETDTWMPAYIRNKFFPDTERSQGSKTGRVDPMTADELGKFYEQTFRAEARPGERHECIHAGPLGPPAAGLAVAVIRRYC